MSSFRKRIALASVCVAAFSVTVSAQERHPADYFGYGAAPSPAQIAGWAIATGLSHKSLKVKPFIPIVLLWIGAFIRERSIFF